MVSYWYYVINNILIARLNIWVFNARTQPMQLFGCSEMLWLKFFICFAKFPVLYKH